MRAAFSEQFKMALEESSILKKTLIRISALVIGVSILFALFLYAYSDQSVDPRTLTLKNYIFYALLPSLIGASCAIYVYSNIIYHIRKIIEELSKESPDWHSLKNEYMESDIKSLYIAIRKLHDTLSDKQKIEEAHEETRRVLNKLNKRMDQERLDIARHLHDDINPKLILIKLESQKLGPIINKNIVDPLQCAEASKIAATILDFTSSIYQDSRNMIKDMRVELIDSVGLTAAIESMVRNYKSALTTLTVHFEHNLPKRPQLSSLATINTYRILQEALLNAVKHSEAKNVTISVQIDKDKRWITVCIKDDGVGINVKNTQGVGLIDMRERARSLGSTLHIESGTGKGTRIYFSFDCDKNSRSQENN